MMEKINLISFIQRERGRRARGRGSCGEVHRRRAAAVIRRGHHGADEVRKGEVGAGDQGTEFRQGVDGRVHDSGVEAGLT